jgi:hypothetical protein
MTGRRFARTGLSALLAAFAQLTSAVAATNAGDFDDIPAMAPPRGEIPPGFWEQYGLLVTIAGGVLFLGAIFIVWRLTRPKPPVVVPIEVQTRETLLSLRDRPESGALLSQISQTLRHYVAGAFSLPAGELTTSELCQALTANEKAGPGLSSALSQFLRRCDEQKFSPAIKPPLGAATQALNLVDLTEARREQLRAAELSKQAETMSKTDVHARQS